LFIDGVIVDITCRKSSEEMLRASEEKFRQLAENIREVFWIGSPDWNAVFYVSPAYEELRGRSCESLYLDPCSWLEAVVEEDREQILVELKRMGAGDLSIPEFSKYRIVRPGGSVRRVYARAFPVRNEQGGNLPPEIIAPPLSREIGGRTNLVLVVDDHIMLRQGLNSLLHLQSDITF
jgi:PAS domain S-box-containing protein